MSKVLTVGEIMMRLQPEGYKRLVQADKFDVCFGGAEANVAVSLASLDLEASFLSKLPDNLLGDAAIKSLRSFGVDTSNVSRGGERLGIYFCEKGASQRGSVVVYDRKYASFSDIEVKEVDIEKALNDVYWLHFTGITPALSEKTEKFITILLKHAKEMGVKVSCDLNYRKKLWTREKAGKVMTSLMQYVDVLISNEEDCKDVFGIEAKGSSIEKGELSKQGYSEIALEIIKRFGVKAVAFSLRESISASINGWSGILCTEEGSFSAKKYNINIVDRIGGGDSFAAGIIYGLIKDFPYERIIEFAVAASALKQTIEGDFNLVSLKEIDDLASGTGSGRVNR